MPRKIQAHAPPLIALTATCPTASLSSRCGNFCTVHRRRLSPAPFCAGSALRPVSGIRMLHLRFTWAKAAATTFTRHRSTETVPAENSIAIQSEVAETIASKLTATLSPEERKWIEQNRPTTYDLYLRARELIGNVQSQSSGYEQCSLAHCWRYRWRFDISG
jgi:hypothetical protein